MAEADFNDVVDEILLCEQNHYKSRYQEGFKAGSEAGNPEGYHLGYHKGAEIGKELGYYLGVTTHHLKLYDADSTIYTYKTQTQLNKVKELIDAFPRTNSEEHDLLAMLDTIRGQFRKELLMDMDNKMFRVIEQIESITKYLTPLLPLANAHMVEFFTENHWDNLLPSSLKNAVDASNPSEAYYKFFNAANGNISSENIHCEITNFVKDAQVNCLKLKPGVCISLNEFEDSIRNIGGVLKQPIKVKEFMTSKKSYEVETMSRLVASLHSTLKTSHCIDIGGGRGQLPTVLALGYNIPSLTVDCDVVSLRSGEKRDKLIQKQWHAISTQPRDPDDKKSNSQLNRFANVFVTKDTALEELIKKNFPEHKENASVIITGLHTCGNLGPDSLRLFVSQDATRAIFNVPCCYHLLTEELTEEPLWSHFESYGCNETLARSSGFPMSNYLQGYTLGRNARMLAAQSIERVSNLRQLPPRSLYYRALLQVIIKEHLEIGNVSYGKLKRISQKCSDFMEYIKAADDLMQLGLSSILDDGELRKIDQHYHDQWGKLVMFYLLRLCLAQVIESVILLDRLCYLCENGFQNVSLVKLFDPVLSPRCHGIVAIR